ncbi:MAG: hypothetical protein AABW52_05810, partial [Nanoarchaeota archaeon]
IAYSSSLHQSFSIHHHKTLVKDVKLLTIAFEFNGYKYLYSTINKRVVHGSKNLSATPWTKKLYNTLI